MEKFIGLVPDILLIASMVCTLAGAVAALTPTPTDDGVVKKVRKVVDFLALNFGNARNK